MDVADALIIVASGFGAGFINTVAGGGSLITLPILIFMGLPPVVANASNRVAIFTQNVFGVLGFKSKGVSAFPFSLWLGLSALAGAILGASIAVDIRGALFNRILALLMPVVVLVIVLKPVRSASYTQERTEGKYQWISIFLFFFVGVWGGFIQAGVGFLIIAVLTSVNHFSLVKTNSAKVLVILVYTTAALAVFIWEGKINWLYGGVMAVGNACGAWVASRWSVKKGDRWIRIILVIVVVAMSVRLWFFY